MTRAAMRGLAWVGWALLGAAALIGLALSAVALLAAVPIARTAVASAVVRVADDAIAGSVKLERIEVLPRGGIELRGLEVLDPDGHLVLAVGRARLSADLTALRSRTIGIEAELEGPSVLLEEEEDGGVSLARAFEPAGRSAEPAPGRGGGGAGGGGAGGGGAGGGGASGWTVHLSRVEIRGGEVWWVDPQGSTRFEAAGLDVAARGTLGSRRERAEIRLRGRTSEPIASPLALDLVASRAGDRIRLPVLRLEAGGTALSALGEGDLVRRRGRLAVTRLGIAREQARVLVPDAPEGDDLVGSGYAESDGATLTAAIRVLPAEGGAQAGRGDAAVAVRLDGSRAAGFDVALDRLDPARVVAAAPRGEVTLTAHGGVAGTSLDDARGRIALAVSRSRLRGGELSRAEVELRASPGTVEVDKLSAGAPGITVAGAGRWRRGGAASGNVGIDAPDLAVATRNLARLLGGTAPAVAGRARLAAELTGTSAAPVLTGTLDAPTLRAGSVVADGVHLALRGTGPLRSVEGSAEGKVAQVRNAAGRELARQASVRAAIQGDEGSLSVTASLPGAGREPLTIDAGGRLGAGRGNILLGHLSLAWPGARWTLARPAMVDLRGPSVDRLELAGGAQRIAMSGGLGARGKIDARVELSRIDLARLPSGVFAGEDGVAGEVSASLEASGTLRRPLVQARLALANGAFRGLAGIAAQGEGRLDGAARRATAALSIARAAGGTVDVAVDVPVPFAGRRAEPLKARVRAAALPLGELLGVAGREGVAGTVAIDARVEGTVGAPALTGEVSLEDGTWEGVEAIAATIAVDDRGDTLRVSASGSIAGRRVLGLDAQAPLDLGDLVARPGETLRALERAPVQARANVTSLDLGALAGRAGIPQGIAGLVDARADLAGTAAAPRGVATVDVAGAAWKGWRRMGAHLELAAREQGVSASGTITSAGQDALRFQGSLAVRPERLGRRDAFLAAPLEIEAVIPRVALAPAAGEALPLSGLVDGRLVASGTPRAPRVTVEVAGTGVAIEGRTLGDAQAAVRYVDQRGHAEVTLRSSYGGTLQASLDVLADLGLGARRGSIRDAMAEAKADSDGVDLRFLAAVAPGTIRSSAGQLKLHVSAKGPLARLSPRGELHVVDGRLAISELGEWTDIAIDASVTDDAVKLSQLKLRRGRGSLSANATLQGLRSEAAHLTAGLRAESFTVARSGMDVATIDVAAEATGTWRGGDLRADVTIPRGVVRLPKKSPRALQSLERRKDIVVGRRPEKKKKEEVVRKARAGPAADPFTLHAHVVVPGNFLVKSDNPKLDVALKADVNYELAGGQDSAEGRIEVIRGNVEPIAGRNFVIERGIVQFTGGPPRTALLDIVAKYHHPATEVTATVTGPLWRPVPDFSAPNMDKSQIAVLLATGRTELKPGSGAASTLAGEEVGRAALGAIATQAFRDLVEDRLPIDVVALDAEGLRTGEYLTDRIYVGYMRRFDADPTKNENENEVRVEYQITPRWMFESRYGNAQSGGASLIWSKDY